MKYKIWSLFFTLLGFTASLGVPVWAVSTQVAILAETCEASVLDQIGVAAGGAVIIAFIVVLTLWRYFSVLIRERLRPHRTLLGFFLIGYLVIVCIQYVIETLEVVFLGGTIGAAIAVVCFFISDQIKEKGVKANG